MDDIDDGEEVTDQKALAEIGLMALDEAGRAGTGRKGALEILRNCGYNGATRRAALLAGITAARKELAAV